MIEGVQEPAEPADRLDWRTQIVPRELREQLRSLAKREPQVRAMKSILGEPKLYEWAASLGAVQYPELAQGRPPLPDEALRRITADRDPSLFLWTGFSDAFLLLGMFEGAGIGPGSRILDFGCGCGRVLRFLEPFAADNEIHGCDVNPKLVEWCGANLPGMSFAHTSPTPPLPYPDDHFDAIWSLSVFTHLPRAAGSAWRTELRRILRPGGVLLATVHGFLSLEQVRADPDLARAAGWDEAVQDAIEQGLTESGHAYVGYDPGTLAKASAGEEYGLFAATPEHVRSAWVEEGLEFVSMHAGALREWQDIVVLRKGR